MRFPGRSVQLLSLSAWVPALVWLVVIAVCAWVAAGWYWRLAGPRSEHAVPAVVTDIASVSREINSRNLFGLPPTSGSEPVAVSNSRYRLLGVAANTGSAPGFAVLQADEAGSIAAIEGQEFEPGVKLLRVLPRSVEIERNGVRESLVLTEEGARGAAPPITPVPPQATPQPAPYNAPAAARPALIQRSAPPEAPNEPPKESNPD